MKFIKYSATVLLSMMAFSAVRADSIPFAQQGELIGKLGGTKTIPYGTDKLLIINSNRIDVLKRIAPDKLKRVAKLGGMRINDAILVDVNGDGKKDIVCAGYTERISGGEHIKEGVGGVYLNSEKGFAKRPIMLEVDDAAGGWSLTVGDVDGDGIKELIFSIRKGGVAVFAGVAKAIPEELLTYNPDIKVTQVAAADFDGDGVAEIAVSQFREPYKILKYDKKTNNLVKVWAGAKKSQSPAMLSAADLNGDGKPDLIQGGRGFWDGKKIEIFLSGKNGKYFNAKPDFGYSPAGDELTDIAKSILITDLNGDSKPDLIIGMSGHETKANFGGKIFFLINDGMGKFTAAETRLESGCNLALFDTDGDGAQDLVVNTPYHSRLKRFKLNAKDLFVYKRKK